MNGALVICLYPYWSWNFKACDIYGYCWAAMIKMLYINTYTHTYSICMNSEQLCLKWERMKLEALAILTHVKINTRLISC